MRALDLPFVTVITDESLSLDALEAIVARACAAPVRPGVQLRARTWSGAALFAAAERLRAVTEACGCGLILNDRIDVALAAGADGVHLPAAGMASARARALVGDRLLGRSVHSLAEIERERAAAAVDYMQFGPVFATASKARYGAPQGLAKLASAVRLAAPLPVVAVGGITADNASEVAQTGAAGVAVIGAVMRARDPAASVRDLGAAWRRPARKDDRRT